jgi:hypothetical protein
LVASLDHAWRAGIPGRMIGHHPRWISHAGSTRLKGDVWGRVLVPEAIVTTVTLLEKGTLSRTPANLLGYQKPLSVNHFVIAAF